MYLRQLVEGEHDAAHLVRIAGVWRWTGEPKLTLGLAELVKSRMGSLPAQLREVVDVLAYAEPLGVAALASLTDPTAVEQAETRGLVEILPDGRRLLARLGHPLFGEVRRAHCGPL